MSVVDLVAQVVRIATPYLLAAAGGVIAERSGVISLTLEGFMLGGAFTAALGTYFFHSLALGVLCGIAGGLLLAGIHAGASIRLRADQVVNGIAINLLAVGATRYFLRIAFDSASNSPRIAGFNESPGLVGLVENPLVWAGLLALPVAWLMLNRTAFGLRVRASGEHPEAARSVGVPVGRVQLWAVLWSGALAGLAGVYLALDQHQFSDQMTASRGYIALAAIIFGAWEPLRAGLACLLFAAAETLEIHLQGTSLVPPQVVEMIPYALTIIALAGVVRRVAPPAALGRAQE